MGSFQQFIKNRDVVNINEEEEQLSRRGLLKGFAASAAAAGGYQAIKSLYQGMQNNLGAEIGLKPGEVLAKKSVNVYDFISKASPNPEKFAKDFQALSDSPTNEIGMATLKNLYKQNVDVYVVKNDVIKKHRSGAEAISAKKNGKNIILMPHTAFSKLPDEYSFGQLTPDGVNLLAHELRHTTQDVSKIPAGRAQDSSEDYDHYMSDPHEMGVRLGKVRNILNKDTIEKMIAKSPSVKPIKITMNDGRKIIIQPKEQAELLAGVLKDDEKIMLRTLLEPEVWNQQLFNNMNFPIIKQRYGIEPYSPQFEQLKKGLAEVTDTFRFMSNDADINELFRHYSFLDRGQKQKYLYELLQNLQQVVKGPVKSAYGSMGYSFT